ncbi:MAG TPA: TIGR03749 family integrating conjugative element protein [Methylophaga aminisulfidivorans]|uniref:TIGR03749 family integrating conjugative element protein n=2 Tax=root TaxID=1 RepID=A0A7C2APX1_9GAMM|nr:TIGR03749 family integrating conjugative element protein [Methylophaga sp.]HEC74274.1 TIGR03749 family integrating conjugative element protein [Methylophaga aminisulfidivorans]
MKLYITIVSALFILAWLPSKALADEKVIWDKTPIRVVLKPNQERMLVFPSNRVRVKIPAAIANSLSTLSNNGVIYWESNEEFTDKRILVQDTISQKTVVIHLSSNQSLGSDEQMTILYPESETDITSSNSENKAPKHYGYETLTRVAAHHLYAPERLINIPEGIHRVNVAQQTDTHLIRGLIINMTPVISFSSNGLYITAVKLVNKQKERVILDPRQIRGKWLAATFQHASLGPNGEITDTTALYLISDRPFWESF